MKRVISLVLALIMISALFNAEIAFAYDAAKPLPTLTGDQGHDLVMVANSQKGYSGHGNDDTIYGAAYNINGLSWCAAFVSWCADKAGISSDIVYRHTYVPTMINWYKNKGTFYKSSPQHGDIVFFEGQDYDGIAGHVGIVDYADNNYVYYIHGNNSSDVVAYSSERLGSSYILGYGRPQYKAAHVDIGTNFYGVILNTACWKPITCDSDGIVRLRGEAGKANQVWKFVRQSDGSYVINSASNGKAMEMYNGDTKDSNPVKVCGEDWGGAYQRWYIYQQGGGYIIKSKHYQELNKVLDLSGGSSAEGNVITTYTQNNTDAQIWSIYKADDVQIKGPTLSVSQGNTATKTKFTWSEVYGEDRYDVKIWKNKLYEGEAYHIEWGATTGYSIQLPAGTYQAYVDASNYYECKPSNTVTFSVSDVKNTVTLNNQSATTAGTTSVTATYGKAMPSITVPKKTGHTFGGYYTGTNGSGTQYYTASGTSARNWDKTANTTLYAKWTPLTYTVTFKNHDGTTLQTKTVNYGGTVSYTGSTPTKPGNAQYTYTFAGWDKSLSNITGNTTITAKFNTSVNKYTITFKNYDGSVLETKTLEYGATITYTGATPTRPADSQYLYTFAGWDKSFGTVTGNTVFTATYTSTLQYYNVKYSEGNIPEQTKKYGETLTLSTVIPQKTGHTFAGWNTKQDGTGDTYQPGDAYTRNESVTLYAQWTKNKYTLNYYVPSGPDWKLEKTGTNEYGSAVILSSPLYIPTGHRFTGWSMSADGTGTLYPLGSSLTIAGNVNLYAQYERVVCTITYDVNGGTGNIWDTKSYQGMYSAITGEIPTREGYKFLGWSRSAGATAAEYKPGGGYIFMEDMTLYAVWKLIPYTNTTVTKKKTYSMFEIDVFNMDEECAVILALYKDGALAECQQETYSGDPLLLASFEEYDSYKVMLWDDMATMVPLCDAEFDTTLAYTKSSVEKSGDTYSVNTSLYNIDSACEVIVAGYKDGRFVTLGIADVSGTSASATITGDIDEIKVVVWDSLAGMKPIAPATTVVL